MSNNTCFEYRLFIHENRNNTVSKGRGKGVGAKCVTKVNFNTVFNTRLIIQARVYTVIGMINMYIYNSIDDIKD